MLFLFHLFCVLLNTMKKPYYTQEQRFYFDKTTKGAFQKLDLNLKQFCKKLFNPFIVIANKLFR